MHDHHRALPWKTVDHVSQLLIIAMKDCWSYMIIDMHHCWSCITIVDHVHETPLIIHDKHWSLPWKPVDHVSQLLIMSMKHRWSYVINIDHCHESLLIMYDVLQNHITMKVIVITKRPLCNSQGWSWPAFGYY